MDQKMIDERKERRKKLQEEARLMELRKRIVFKIAHLEKTDQPYTIHYENAHLDWIYSNVRIRKKDRYLGLHGDFQIDVDDSTAIETVTMKEEEINSAGFQKQFSAHIPDSANVIICYDGGDPELEISIKTFLSHPTTFLSHPDTWIISIDKCWIIEYILDQDAIRLIQLKESVPTLVKKILLEG